MKELLTDWVSVTEKHLLSANWEAARSTLLKAQEFSPSDEEILKKLDRTTYLAQAFGLGTADAELVAYLRILSEKTDSESSFERYLFLGNYSQAKRFVTPVPEWVTSNVHNAEGYLGCLYALGDLDGVNEFCSGHEQLALESKESRILWASALDCLAKDQIRLYWLLTESAKRVEDNEEEALAILEFCESLPSGDRILVAKQLVHGCPRPAFLTDVIRQLRLWGLWQGAGAATSVAFSCQLIDTVPATIDDLVEMVLYLRDHDNFRKADDYMWRALKIMSDHPSIPVESTRNLFLLAQAAANLGSKNLAMVLLNRYYRQDPSDEVANVCGKLCCLYGYDGEAIGFYEEDTSGESSDDLADLRAQKRGFLNADERERFYQ